MRPALHLAIKIGAAFVWYCYAPGIASTQPKLDAVLSNISFTAAADSLDLPGPYGFGIGVVYNTGGPTGFHYFKFTPSFPLTDYRSFLFVSPSAGVAPAWPYTAGVAVGLNPTIVPYMPAGNYLGFISFAPTGGQLSDGAGVSITLKLNGVPPVIQSVVNAATLQPVISPGAIVSIFGSHLGTAPVTAYYNEAGLYPTDLSRRSEYFPESTSPHEGVYFNGIAAPMLYYRSNQINAVVPYGIAGQTSVNVVVIHNGTTAPFPVATKDTAPGIFTAAQNGSGQGAILNASPSDPNRGTPNGTATPAPKGSVITLFATGAGVLQQPAPDGSVLFGRGETCSNALVSTSCKATDAADFFYPAAPVSLSIGGQPAPLLYVGPSPGTVSGLLQVNAVVPNGIASGPQPVVLTIGQNNDSQQQVTVVVQ
ncbi:MAG: hypothetical protein C5B51_01815 [Terriglobia bacterium]|nr:MAG: hypothetical protein C5B51_01815 [Terriglobia bacterium]